jgi:hypothetical protein
MYLLQKISTLPSEIQNLIFYYANTNKEADIIKKIDWNKEYKNCFYMMTIRVESHPFYQNVRTNNVFGFRYVNVNDLKYKLRTYDDYDRIIENKEQLRFKNFGFTWLATKQSLADHCIQNGIKKFNKNDKKKMIQLLMKI